MKIFSKTGKIKGFTLVELMVVVAILGVMLSFGLANFRAGQNSQALETATKEMTDVIENTRTMTLGGQVVGQPNSGGFGVHLDLSSPNQIMVFADYDQSGNYSADEELAERTVALGDVTLLEVCAYSGVSVSSPPCTTPDWSETGSTALDIVFPVPGQINAHNGTDELDYSYVGGVLQHEKTLRKSYFYVSLNSGLIGSNVYQVSTPADPDGSGAAPGSECGNGSLEEGEICEADLDCGSGQFCDGSCQCQILGGGSTCGDGVVQAPETCDGNDGCEVSGETCDASCIACGPTCGNGEIDAGETCEFDSQCASGQRCGSCTCYTPIKIDFGGGGSGPKF